MRNGDGKGEAGVKERREVKPSPVSSCRSACLVGLLRYFKMSVSSPYILLYYSLLSPKGEEVKAEKRKNGGRAHARGMGVFYPPFYGRMGESENKKAGTPENGSARRKDREKNNEERYALSFSKISPSPDFLTRMGCAWLTLPLKMAFERSLSKKFCKARFTGRAP